MRRFLAVALMVPAFIFTASSAKAETSAEEAAGRQVFEHCIACHFIDPGKQGFGPNLHGIPISHLWS